MKKNFFYLIVILGVVGWGCLDPIDFPDVDQDELLIIEGQFTPADKPHFVRISRTAPFSLKTFQGVGGARVVLHAGDRQQVYGEGEEGVYVLNPGGIRGMPGESYFIEVELADGSSYRSVEEVMPAGQQADSAFFLFEKEVFVQPSGIDRFATVLNIYLNTALDRQDLHLRWYVEELYSFPEETCGGLDIPFTCYIPVAGNPQNISLYSNEEVGLNDIAGLKVATKTSFPAVEFKGPHYFSVYQHSITQNAFNYWQKVVDIVSQSGTVFDKPPAQITGNVYNTGDPSERVLGYFELAVTDTVRTTVLPSTYQEVLFRSPYCSPFVRFRWEPECCNCLRIPNSTLERPSWLD